MKKEYEKPIIEIVSFEADEDIMRERAILEPDLTVSNVPDGEEWN